MPGHSKRGYLLENFRLFHLKSRGGAQVEYHYHEFCKILLLLQGSGGYYVDGQRYLLQPGDILLLDGEKPLLSLNLMDILLKRGFRLVSVSELSGFDRW